MVRNRLGRENRSMKTIEKNKSTTLIDNFGRPISYVRISVTENCNLRCRYCYDSACGTTKKAANLSGEQLITLINAFAAMGINKIRFTGGEPTLRKDIIDLVRATSGIDGITQTGLTTNGLLLTKLLPDLTDAGLNRLNISLDTLKRWKFKEITGSDNFEKVYDGIMQALECEVFRPLKVNTLVMRGINDDEIPRFAGWALNYGIDLRFIEFMPTRKSRWGKERFFSESEMKNAMNLSLDRSLDFDNSPGPAKSYSHENYPGRISFISAVSDNFCGECNRIRLTSHGDLVGCLFSNHKISILDLLKSNPDQTEIIDFIKNVINTPGFRRQSHLQSISDSLPFIQTT